MDLGEQITPMTTKYFLRLKYEIKYQKTPFLKGVFAYYPNVLNDVSTLF